MKNTVTISTHVSCWIPHYSSFYIHSALISHCIYSVDLWWQTNFDQKVMLYFREWHFGIEGDSSAIHVLKFRPADTNSFLCIHSNKYATKFNDICHHLPNYPLLWDSTWTSNCFFEQNLPCCPLLLNLLICIISTTCIKKTKIYDDSVSASVYINLEISWQILKKLYTNILPLEDIPSL